MSKNICPFISTPKNMVPCLEHDCSQYVQIMGNDPQTGEMINKWACAAAFLPMLVIEGAQMSRQTGAAVESFRNEMVRMNEGEQPKQVTNGRRG